MFLTISWHSVKIVKENINIDASIDSVSRRVSRSYIYKFLENVSASPNVFIFQGVKWDHSSMFVLFTLTSWSVISMVW